LGGGRGATESHVVFAVGGEKGKGTRKRSRALQTGSERGLVSASTGVETNAKKVNEMALVHWSSKAKDGLCGP